MGSHTFESVKIQVGLNTRGGKTIRISYLNRSRIDLSKYFYLKLFQYVKKEQVTLFHKFHKFHKFVWSPGGKLFKMKISLQIRRSGRLY